jgi:hypothetical protein
MQDEDKSDQTINRTRPTQTSGVVNIVYADVQ